MSRQRLRLLRREVGGARCPECGYAPGEEPPIEYEIEIRTFETDQEPEPPPEEPPPCVCGRQFRPVITFGGPLLGDTETG